MPRGTPPGRIILMLLSAPILGAVLAVLARFIWMVGGTTVNAIEPLGNETIGGTYYTYTTQLIDILLRLLSNPVFDAIIVAIGVVVSVIRRA